MLDLGRTLLQSVERSPHALALVDGELRWTYAEWASRVGAVQRGLHQAGLRRGDHLLLILQNRWEMATLHWACQFAGIVVTPLNWRANGDEISYCIEDSGARALVYESATASSVRDSLRASECLRISLADVQETSANIGFAEWLVDLGEPTPQADAQDLSLMLYTSGTTGRPKGVPRRQRAERIAALAHIAQNRYAVGERTLGVMPLYHTMGVRSLLSLALLDGRFVCIPRFNAGFALAAIAREQISHLYLVPTLYHDLLSHPDFTQTDISSVRKLGFAGAPMHDGLLQKLDATFKPELFVNHYGSSEIYTVAINQQAVAKPGAAGRAGLNARLRVVPLDADNAEIRVAQNVEGQIVADLHGDEAFEGYHKRPDADAKSLRGGWYFTGDTGYVDNDGDLFVTGRVDDMIISGGENISPVDIESVLSLHPAVDEVAVAGLHDERWGQKVVAFVKKRSPVDAQTLDAHCRASDLVNFKRPREYVFVRAIPRSPVGKVLRRQLVTGEFEHIDPEAATAAMPVAPVQETIHLPPY